MAPKNARGITFLTDDRHARQLTLGLDDVPASMNADKSLIMTPRSLKKKVRLSASRPGSA